MKIGSIQNNNIKIDFGKVLLLYLALQVISIVFFSVLYGLLLAVLLAFV